MRATVFLMLAAMGSASAHDLYLMPQRFHVASGETVGVAVHDGDAFPASEVSPPIERLRDASLGGSLGAAEVRNLHIDGKRASAGKWRLYSLKIERCADASAADWESYWASLTFEIR